MVAEYRIIPGEGIASLVPREVSRAPLLPGQVRVAVKAISLNARDALILAGQYPIARDVGRIPCSDGAGVVVEVGSAVDGRKIGDRVVGSFFRDWIGGPASQAGIVNSYGCELDGWLSTEVVLPAQATVLLPEALSFADAACAPCAGVTAWQALFGDVRLRPGSTVVATGTGGLAMWCSILAAAAGHDCILTSSSNEKLSRLAGPRVAGVNYVDHPDWADEVRSMTDGRGADLVLDLGGEQTIIQSLAACAYGGSVAVIGGTTGWEYPRLQPLALLRNNLTLRGVYVGSAAALADLLAFIARRDVRPLVSRVFGFDEAKDAFNALVRQEQVGKIVIEVR
jgi:NADPH:quinone reductase-like Zn-dependent oxidoreductase